MEACTNPNILRIILYITQILKIIFYIVPIGLIVIMGIDFFKNVIASKEEDMKKNISIAIKRIIFCICIFFVPTIVNLVNSILGDLGVNYVACFKNANSEYIQERVVAVAEEAIAVARENQTMSYILEAQTAIEEIEDASLRDELLKEIDQIKSNVISEAEQKRQEEIEIVPGTNNENSSNNKKFLYKIDHPNTSYSGHTVELTDSQYLKVLRSVFGEQEQGSYELYVGLCQYIRDYIDYGRLNRTYDNLGSFWLLRGGSLSSSYNLEWFKENRPELIKAVDYVFKQGGSLAQRKLCFYVDDDDVTYNNGSYTAAHNRLIKASCGGGHEHDKIRLAPEENPSNWSEFNFGILQDSNAEDR